LRALTPDWPALPRVRSAFTLRVGGVSESSYRELNLGAHVGDEPAAVMDNRQRVRRALSLPAEPLWLSQVHGTAVFDADAAPPDPDAAPPRADAALTRQAGRVLSVLVADCLPVLIARCDGSAVAVAHAGWRGLAAGVLENAVAALGSAAQPLQAWLGPGIGPNHFEVGAEVRAAFCEPRPQDASAFVANARGRWQCDLPALARARLAALGINRVYGAPRCTFARPELFYSHRRDGVTGRMAALLWLEDAP